MGQYSPQWAQRLRSDSLPSGLEATALAPEGRETQLESQSHVLPDAWHDALQAPLFHTTWEAARSCPTFSGQGHVLILKHLN